MKQNRISTTGGQNVDRKVGGRSNNIKRKRAAKWPPQPEIVVTDKPVSTFRVPSFLVKNTWNQISTSIFLGTDILGDDQTCLAAWRTLIINHFILCSTKVSQRANCSSAYEAKRKRLVRKRPLWVFDRVSFLFNGRIIVVVHSNDNNNNN